MIYLALSCLQGRPLIAAARELLALEPDGLQLTPGSQVNNPSACLDVLDDEETLSHVLAAHDVRGRARTHHGFSWNAPRVKDVWSPDGDHLTDDDSVHPPRAGQPWRPRTDRVYEVMYPGYRLGSGDEVEDAMRDGLRLAVDVSHVWIQLRQGAMTEATWRRLADYNRVEEVHVSANDGRRDTHRPIDAGVHGLGWARERQRAGAVVVLECYMHRLSVDDRLRQVDLLR